MLMYSHTGDFEFLAQDVRMSLPIVKINHIWKFVQSNAIVHRLIGD